MKLSTVPAENPCLLLVAPATDMAADLAVRLSALGCEILRATDSLTMRRCVAQAPPQLVLFDGPGALDALRALRRQSRLPALVLVPPGLAIERVIALESGADDAMAHPVEPRELFARLRALLRRSHPLAPRESHLRFGGWRLDPQTRQLHAATGLRVPLSHAEFRLLQTFLEHPGSVLGRDELMDLARGRSMQAFERSIDLLVSRLRAKLRDDPRAPRHIRTVRGVGYLFDIFGIEHPMPAPMFPVRYQADNSA